ncbi:MAG: glycosyltransferase [Candidatus Omnitrophota bacterium]
MLKTKDKSLMPSHLRHQRVLGQWKAALDERLFGQGLTSSCRKALGVFDPKEQKKRVLVFHVAGLAGGSEEALALMQKKRAAACDYLILHDVGRGLYWGIANRKPAGWFRLRTEKDLKQVIAFCRIDDLLINQAAYADPAHLAMLLTGFRGRYDLEIHDYYPVCFHTQLVDEQGKSCEEKCAQEGPELEEHRSFFRKILQGAREVRVPSASAQAIYRRHFPEVATRVVSREPLYHYLNIAGRIPRTATELRVGVLGALAVAKGAHVLKELSRRVRQAGLPIRIKHFGYTHLCRRGKFERGVWEILGCYEHQELPALIAREEIDLFLFPSIWPETYSYACEEILQLGFPILMFDLGAQVERIAQGRYGWTVPLEAGAGGLFEKLKLFLKERNMITEKKENLRREKVQADIVLPFYNRLDRLKACVASLIKNTDVRSRLLLIDDGSSEAGIDAYLGGLRSDNPWVEIKILRQQQNSGFVRAVNMGWQYSGRHVVVLNSDALVPPGWLSRLLAPALLDGRVASITPYSNNGTICSFPEIDRYNPLPVGHTVDSLDACFRILDQVRPILIPTGVGFCMWFNRNAIADVGDLDETLFGRGYGEENDWCLRASRKGYKHLHVQNLFVYHEGGASFGEAADAQKQENIGRLLAKYPDYHKKIGRFIGRDPGRKFREQVMAHLGGTGISGAKKGNL